MSDAERHDLGRHSTYRNNQSRHNCDYDHVDYDARSYRPHAHHSRPPIRGRGHAAFRGQPAKRYVSRDTSRDSHYSRDGRHTDARDNTEHKDYQCSGEVRD